MSAAELYAEAKAILSRPASDPRPMQRRAYRRHWRSVDAPIGERSKAVGVLRRALAETS